MAMRTGNWGFFCMSRKVTKRPLTSYSTQLDSVTKMAVYGAQWAIAIFRSTKLTMPARHTDERLCINQTIPLP